MQQSKLSYKVKQQTYPLNYSVWFATSQKFKAKNQRLKNLQCKMFMMSQHPLLTMLFIHTGLPFHYTTVPILGNYFEICNIYFTIFLIKGKYIGYLYYVPK